MPDTILEEAQGNAESSTAAEIGAGSVSKMYIAIDATRWVWEESQSERSARLVLLAIAAHCNDDGYCWPGMDAIIGYAKLSKPTVLQALEELTKIQEVMVEKGGRGPGDTNHYYLAGYMKSRVKKGKENQNKGKEDPEKGSTRVDPNKNLEQEILEQAPSARHIDLVNQAIQESHRTGQSADEILKRLRSEAA